MTQQSLRFTPPSGPVTARRDGSVVRATGIRYATAGRFEPPVPEPDHSDDIDATAWAPMCPQAPDALADAMFGADQRDLPMTEDCLRLSVTTPVDAAPDAGLPVMVWIHGGGFVTGAGDQSVMDPASLVTEQNVVVVTVTYRLGLLGFVQTAHGPRANLGLLDQIAAFRWVRRNIAAFGGDPRNVTAFGQSAGAQAIADIMATPRAAELFDRAILQSAPLGIMRGRDALTAAVAAAADGVRQDSTPAEIAAAQVNAVAAGGRFGLRGAMPIAPQYGIAPLPAEDELDHARAASRAIDVLIGSTSEEARLFLPALPGMDRIGSIPLIRRLIERAVVAVCTSLVYTRGVRQFARTHRRAGGRVATYRLSWSAPGNPVGAAHTIDLPLLFGDAETWRDARLVAGATSENLQRDARMFRAGWAGFARDGSVPLNISGWFRVRP